MCTGVILIEEICLGGDGGAVLGALCLNLDVTVDVLVVLCTSLFEVCSNDAIAVRTSLRDSKKKKF